MAAAGHNVATEVVYQIEQQLNALKNKTQECGQRIEATRQDQEKHSIQFYRHHQISVQLDGGQYQESSPDYIRMKEWRDTATLELRQSVNLL